MTPSFIVVVDVDGTSVVIVARRTISPRVLREVAARRTAPASIVDSGTITQVWTVVYLFCEIPRDFLRDAITPLRS
jgi:hypothetical protein